MTTLHPDYSILAARLELVSLHSRTLKSFSAFITRTDTGTVLIASFGETLVNEYSSMNRGTRVTLATICGRRSLPRRQSRCYPATFSRLRHELVRSSHVHMQLISSLIRVIGSLSFKTLEHLYLLKDNGIVIERPQFMWMRVAVQLHGKDLGAVVETYDMLSRGFYIHATPTLKNAGTSNPQLASCFIHATSTTDTESVYGTLAKLANIFQHDGGLGIDVHNVPATRSVKLLSKNWCSC